MRLAGVSLMLAAVAVSVLGCKPVPKELKVAVICPLSGGFSGWGILVRNGAQLAVDQWNAKGGVLGMRIVLLGEDSKGNPSEATGVVGSAIARDKIHYFIGDVFSSLTIPVSDLTNSSRVILISPTSTNDLVTVDPGGATKPYVFRACFSDAFQGGVGAVFAFKNLKARRAYVLEDPSDQYVSGLARAFADAFSKQGGTIAGDQSYSNSDTDFSNVLAAFRGAKPDVIYLPAASIPLINAITREAKEKGVAAVFLGGDFWDSPELDLKASDGAYYTSHYWPADSRPEVRSFTSAYAQKYSVSELPDVVAGLSFDAMNVLLTAIQSAGRDDVDRVRAALEGMEYSGGVGGQVRFDHQHNAVKEAAVVHVTDGRTVLDSSVSP